MGALEAARPDCARFVGGCVRNELLDVVVADIDIATQLKPEETIAALKTAGIRAIPTGIEHGTITAVCDGEPFEITSLRRDVETDGRRAVVAFTEDWNEDAHRRDFRLNALYADAEGQVFDPTGGLDDIAARKVVFIGNAQTRLREDHLRNLRFFRFTAWYADSIDETGLAACVSLKDGLQQIAAERIWKELEKLFAAPDPYATVAAMWQSGVLAVVLPEARDQSQFLRLKTVEDAGNLQPDGVQRLLTMFPRDEGIARAVSSRLRMSRAEADRLKFWAKAADMPQAEADLKAWLYGLPVQTGVDLVLWFWSADPGRKIDWLKALDIARNWERPVFPLKGADLLKQGMSPGRDVGETLKSLEARWVAAGFKFDGWSDEITNPQIRSAIQSKR